jgi:chromosomal replication initiator protein
MGSSARASADAAGLWSAVVERLQQNLNDQAYTTWFGSASPRSLDDRTLEVSVPNEFTRAWIEGHFGSLIAAAARDAGGAELDVRFTVALPAAADAAGADLDPLPSARPVAAEPVGREAARLNANYTFDHFVIGSSNRFAHAAALAVAETPAQSYNPLFLAGSTGLGKTHLLQAIAHYVLDEHAGLRVRYVTCEAFTNDFIDALQEKRLEQFKGRYRAYDVLLVDDIQFLAGKQRMQEEFFHTFNTLYESGSQIVLSSDRPPKDISPLEGRLRSRFEWGLIADIQPPDLETRVAILLKKANRDGITIADRDVLTAIAQRIQTNIRELEGALTRVVAYASLNGVPITVDLVRDVLHDQFPEGARLVTVEEIQKVVADHFRLTVSDLRSDRRTQNVVFPRQIAMYLCRDLTDLSLPKIGEKFGGRDHTTVHYGLGRIAQRMREDRAIYNLVQDLTARVRRL